MTEEKRTGRAGKDPPPLSPPSRPLPRALRSGLESLLACGSSTRRRHPTGHTKNRRARETVRAERVALGAQSRRVSRRLDCGMVWPGESGSIRSRSEAMRCMPPEWDSRSRSTHTQHSPRQGGPRAKIRKDWRGPDPLEETSSKFHDGSGGRDPRWWRRCTIHTEPRGKDSAEWDGRESYMDPGGWVRLGDQLMVRRVGEGTATRARRPRFARGPSNLTGNSTRRVRGAAARRGRPDTARTEGNDTDTTLRGVASPQAGNESLRASRPLGLRALSIKRVGEVGGYRRARRPRARRARMAARGAWGRNAIGTTRWRRCRDRPRADVGRRSRCRCRGCSSGWEGCSPPIASPRRERRVPSRDCARPPRPVAASDSERARVGTSKCRSRFGCTRWRFAGS